MYLVERVPVPSILGERTCTWVNLLVGANNPARTLKQITISSSLLAPARRRSEVRLRLPIN